jgi:hypothetical protein
LSLARTAAILTDNGKVPEQEPAIKLPVDGPWEDRVYSSGIGRSGGCASHCISSETHSFGSIPPRARVRPTPCG